MNLIIVESPTKAKTITKFLGKEYKVESSFGHIRDLPDKKMGIDLKNDFEPEYVVPAKSTKTVANLKKLAAKADKVILASDEDREGEAISWHLIQALDLDKGKKKNAGEKIERIVFHEITKDAILHALQNPRELDMNLVDAQQARRILDRLVGYELSPFLWKKVAKGLSAGRVQSVAVRMIVEREREIKAFNIEEYWSLEAKFQDAKAKFGEFTASLNKIGGKTFDKLFIKNKEQADEILKALGGAEYVVSRTEKKQGKKSAPAPFTTSSLQITANRMLGFSAKQTMTLAQKLYETGHITYMRTDSLNLSDKFLGESMAYLKSSLGAEYALPAPRHFKTKKKGAQEAHEAVRPTEASNDPEKLKDKFEDNGLFRLYRLIWQRAMASQMPDAIFDNTTIDIDALKTEYQFRSTGQVMKFDGYLKIFPEKSQEIELPDVKEKDPLDLKDIKGAQHFTKPPARYSDAGLVKELEAHGIGRPSTYAPTINTIITRNYVVRNDDKRLAPTDIAFVVTDLLVAHFPEIIDYQFTAGVEKKLDDIADGKRKWKPVIGDFYGGFHDNLESKNIEIKKENIMPEETSNVICDKCGSPMIVKTGRYGKFLACTGYPKCKNIKSMKVGADGQAAVAEKSEEVKALEEKYKAEVCDKCGAAMVVKTGRFGPFLSCSAYPKCKNIKNIKGEGNKGTGVKCPNCGKGEIVAKSGKRGVFYACDNYPECKTAYWSKPNGDKCADCGSLMVFGKNDTVVCSNKDCGKKK